MNDQQKIEDIAERMTAFRAGMDALVQKHNIHPDAELSYQTAKIETGIVLIDRVHQNRDLNEKARELCFKRFHNLEDAQEADAQAAFNELVEGKGDKIKKKKK
jgi:hypothetical protein